MEMCLFVLREVAKVDRLLQAWNAVGLQGIAVLEGECVVKPIMPHVGARHAFGFHGTRRLEEPELILLGVAQEKAQVEACLAATEEIVGSLSEPGRGLFLSWPLAVAKGLAAQTSADDAHSEEGAIWSG